MNAPVHAEYKRIREEFSKKLKGRRRDFVKGKMEAAGNDQKKLWKAVSETSVEWFKKYLSDRECVVQIGVDTATGFTPNRGVPQGSIIGPISFLLSADLRNIQGDLKILAPSTNSMQMTSLS